jgi:hypothetical protein
MTKLSVSSFIGVVMFLTHGFGGELLSQAKPALECHSGTKQLLVQNFKSRTNKLRFAFFVSATDKVTGNNILTPDEVRPYSTTDSYGYFGNQISIAVSRIQSSDLPFGKVRASIKIGNLESSLWLCSL